ncbi:hypothetical protein BGY98DRAFT_411417 [Russula aff. rugulosa BPL654]|nr:hypothetical protein BGY98DRAFT_411417 [Russula aff. rugulosa BPL654]
MLRFPLFKVSCSLFFPVKNDNFYLLQSWPLLPLPAAYPYLLIIDIDFFRQNTPPPIYARQLHDAPNLGLFSSLPPSLFVFYLIAYATRILLDKSAYHPFLLHFPWRGSLNP